MPYTALITLAQSRMDEAGLLLRSKLYSGAAYIVGYAVELLLKAYIASRTQAGNWPVVQLPDTLRTHDFDLLAQQAGLEGTLRAAARANITFSINWDTARFWSPSMRYITLSQREARDLVAAISDQPHGIATWLKARM